MSELAAAAGRAEGLRGEVEVTEPTRAERTLARRSAETRATVPTVEFSAEVSLESCLEREREFGCGLIAFVVRAAAEALRTVPRVNGAYRDGHFERYSRVNVGVTLIDDGIYATPTILDADRRSEPEIGVELASFRTRLRDGDELRGNETAGATFTVFDWSEFAIAPPTPMITPPQAAALAAGPPREAAVVRDGEVAAGLVMTLVLAVDHRIVYGQPAAAFLEAVKADLERGRG